MDYAIETRSLSVEFRSRGGTVRALDRLDLRVRPGQVFGFLGPNGAGKTTTMHALLGFIAPTAGEAFLFGEDIRHSIARKRIGYLPEHPDTYRFLTGVELLKTTGHMFNMTGRALRKRIDEVLAHVGLIEPAGRRISTYSRGMMQRICLAQALLNDPDLVILDEPTSGLDPFGRAQIRTIIADLRIRGKTVFFSSHELSEVELVCDTLAILADGHMVTEGPVAEIVKPGENLERFFMRTVTERRSASTASSKGGRP